AKVAKVTKCVTGVGASITVALLITALALAALALGGNKPPTTALKYGLVFGSIALVNYFLSICDKKLSPRQKNVSMVAAVLAVVLIAMTASALNGHISKATALKCMIAYASVGLVVTPLSLCLGHQGARKRIISEIN
ncbi:MAG: hypothetical protein H7A36_07900, partial [Chlamydiales bacterium]|nr:hypothetical protein [Chlamydiales bacterium]